MIFRNTAGAYEAVITREYALAFDMLDNGFMPPEWLEMELLDQGYNLEHLYEIHEVDEDIL